MERTIQTSIGPVKIRGLKHGELKSLNFKERIDNQDGEALQEEILQKVFPPEELARLDELVAYERTMLFSKIIELTFMPDEQRKNYSWQWGSTLPVSEVIASTANDRDSSNPGDAQTLGDART